MKNLLPLLALAFLALQGHSQEGYRIQIDIDQYEEDTLYLGYYMGNRQYVRDTVAQNPDGNFVFQGEEALPGGVYLVVMQPDKQFFQMLLDEGAEHQQFSLSTTHEHPVGDMQVEGSRDNQLFYDYLNFLGAQRPLADSLRQQASQAAPQEQKALEARVAEIDETVKTYQERILREHPETMTAVMIQANMPLDMPEFQGEGDAPQRKQLRFLQKHYFDNIDLTDSRLLRTPFLFQRVDYYVHKLYPQHPDTISRAIDLVLEKMKPSRENFQYYLVHFLNEAARSKYVGMDAVYVHLVEKYYETGQADWTEEQQLRKIIDNARKMKPLLIGKIAPDIQLRRRDSTKVSLHGLESPYTVLYFWRYDCGHCKQSTPHMKAFYEKFKDRGVELFAVCVKRDMKEIRNCWDYVDEKEVQDWLHTMDPGYRSFFPVKYNIKSTPQIYILNREKEILAKGIGAKQLEEVMQSILEEEKQKEEAGD